MLNNYGRVFRKLREDKGLSTRELANYTKQISKEYASSKSSIAKFENKSTNIPFPKLSVLLNVLNVTVEEFALHAEEVHNSIEVDFDSIRRAFDEKDCEALEYLANQYRKEKGMLFRNEHLAQICDGFVKRIKGKDHGEVGQLTEVEKYLLNTDYWHYYEVNLFATTMFFFDEERLDTLLKRAIKRMDKYNELNVYSDDSVTLLTNAIGHFSENGYRDLAQKYLIILKKHLDAHPRAIYEKIRFKFFVGLDSCLYGDRNEGIKKIKAMIEELREYDLEVEANKYESYLHTTIIK